MEKFVKNVFLFFIFQANVINVHVLFYIDKFSAQIFKKHDESSENEKIYSNLFTYYHFQKLFMS